MTFAHYSPETFGHVAVLMGGQSAEREISLESGQAVFDALLSQEVKASLIDFGPESFSTLHEQNYDRVFIALHGRGGEDGAIQGALETIGLPYSGSGVTGSALAMDKLLSKVIWQHAGLPVPAAMELDEQTKWSAVIDKLSLPLMVKPVREGSSIGATKVTQAEELKAAWHLANRHDPMVMAETWVSGAEYTVSILGDRILPIIKLETKRDFYDYQAKYIDDDTQYLCPCGLDAEVEQTLGDLALQACCLLGVSGWARVDVLIDKQGQLWIIEVNTVPGMTSHSLVPMSARQAGLSFAELVLQILASSLTTERVDAG